MNTEKDTCQKSGTSVIFQKEITQCVPIVESTQMTGSMTKKRFVKKLEIN